MDQLQLEWIDRAQDKRKRPDPCRQLAVLINGTSVEALVQSFEAHRGLPHRGDLFLSAEQIRAESLDGWQKSLQLPTSRIPVLICGCGDPVCSSLSVLSTRQDDWVHWRFSTLHQAAYADLPDFWFSAEAYHDCVSAALSALPPR